MVKIVVEVRLGGEIIKITVGDGIQTFKWLAGAVQLRRGPKNAVRITGFRNLEGELFNPIDKVFEHSVQEQLIVDADFEYALPIDDYGDPIASEWMQAAYVNSNHGVQWHDEASAWRSKLNDAIITEMEGEGKDISLIQIGDFSEADIESAFNLDWSKIRIPYHSHSGFVASNETADDINRIRNNLRKYYFILSNIFIFYAGYGQVGHRYGMTVAEFGHFLHHSQVLPYNTDTTAKITRPGVSENSFVDNASRAFESLFASTVNSSGVVNMNSANNKASLFPLMSRSEFIEGILNTLVYKYKIRSKATRVELNAARNEEYKESDDIDPIDLWEREMEQEESKTQSNEREESKYSPVKSLNKNKKNQVSSVNIAIKARSDMLHQLEFDLNEFLQVNVSEYWSHLTNTSVLYCSPNEDTNSEVKIIVYNLYQIAKQAFLAYCSNGKGNWNNGPTISVDEFVFMLEDCSLLDTSNTEHVDIMNKIIYSVLTPYSTASSSLFGCTCDSIRESTPTGEMKPDTGNDKRSRGGSRGIASPGSSGAARASPPSPRVPQQGDNASLLNALQIPLSSSVWKILPELCFCEVLECITKLATITLESRPTIPERVKLALDFIGELQTFGHK